MEDAIPGIRRRSLVEAATVEDWWRNTRSPLGSLDEMLWGTIALELWAQIFVDGKVP
jgi:hypothetical protein